MANFLSLPGELRNMIYEYLFLLDSLRPLCGALHRWSFPRIPLSAQFLLTNKTIYHEARTVLYSQNCFEFIHDHITCPFLDMIGRINAGYIRTVCTEIIDIYCPESYGKAPCARRKRMLEKIGSHCTGLEILVLKAFNTPRYIFIGKDIVSKIDASLRAIPSLREIIVDTYKDILTIEIQTRMKSLGWKVRIHEVK